MEAASPTRWGSRASFGRLPRIRPKSGAKLKAKRSLAIRIAAAIVAFALFWYGSLRAAQISGVVVVNIAAKAVLLILTCLACIAIGFFLPMAPVLRNFIGSAVYAGSLATAGAIAGMYVADAILARLEPREPGTRASAAPSQSSEETRRHG